MTSHRKDKRLSVLTDAEKFALYGLPDFDESQQLEFLLLSASELELATNRLGLQVQVYCILQIGYFKAKRAFFRFTLSEVESDCEFVLSRYFRHIASFKDTLVANHEYYVQRKLIAELLGYPLWSDQSRQQLEQQAAQIVQRNVTPGFVSTELIIWLNEQHIIRPRYSTLQELISSVLSAERRCLGDMLAASLDESACIALSSLLKSDDTFSQLAALKQDAKDFGRRQMVGEHKKCSTLAPIYQIARTLLHDLGISRQNLLYYTRLSNFYTARDLRDPKADQTRLYLLCYAWVRYRQLTDNLVEAMFFRMRQLEEECRAEVQRSLSGDQVRHSKEIRQVGRLLSLYVDERVVDLVPFGEVRKRAWKIMSRYMLQSTAQRMSVKPVSKLVLHWKAVDGLVDRIRRHLRPLYVTLNFVGINANSPWLLALYLRDPQRERHSHRSQNRIESYHQFRSEIAKVGGRKELAGRTDIEVEISNQCGRLVANALIYYNSAILSHLLEKYEASGNTRIVEFLSKISPIAWQHVLLNGHYRFKVNMKPIVIEELVSKIEWH